MSHKLLKDMQADLKTFANKYANLKSMPNKIARDLINAQDGLTSDEVAKLQRINYNELVDKDLTLPELQEIITNKLK